MVLKSDSMNVMSSIFSDLYRETEERAGFVSKTDDYFITLLTHMEIKY